METGNMDRDCGRVAGSLLLSGALCFALGIECPPISYLGNCGNKHIGRD